MKAPVNELSDYSWSEVAWLKSAVLIGGNRPFEDLRLTLLVEGGTVEVLLIVSGQGRRRY